MKQFIENAGNVLGRAPVMPMFVAQAIDQELAVVGASCCQNGWKQDLILQPVHGHECRRQSVRNLAATGRIDAARQGIGNRLEAVAQFEKALIAFFQGIFSRHRQLRE
ncbi:hypothetical protein [Ensifer sp. M14]|uniref:hypothetical protein n=1 Tax=Ensifer sp. M14 TaxID=2203782 RepID=UPI001FCE400E|nr:hypothetical protein [Ensifer sp. M14]